MRRLLDDDDRAEMAQIRDELQGDLWLEAQARHDRLGHEGDFATTCTDPCCERDSYR